MEQPPLALRIRRADLRQRSLDLLLVVGDLALLGVVDDLGACRPTGPGSGPSSRWIALVESESGSWKFSEYLAPTLPAAKPVTTRNGDPGEDHPAPVVDAECGEALQARLKIGNSAAIVK